MAYGNSWVAMTFGFAQGRHAEVRTTRHGTDLRQAVRDRINCLQSKMNKSSLPLR
jgi:hypothetical protein